MPCHQSIMHKTTVLLAVLGLGLVSFLAVASMAPAQSETSGTLTLESKSIAIGVGVSWGDGILTYRGKQYPFSVSGLSVVDLGVSKVTARGNVANLKNLQDFNGNYAAAGAGATVGGGAGAAVMRNQNGVEIALTATTQGVKLSLPVAGVDIKLKK
jgi:preprotein translocase subunit SecG